MTQRGLGDLRRKATHALRTLIPRGRGPVLPKRQQVLLSLEDWQSHAFAPVPTGTQTRTAACGTELAVFKLEDNGEKLPGCEACLLSWGMFEADALEAQKQQARDKIEAAVAEVAGDKLKALASAGGALSGHGHAKAVSDLRRANDLVRAWVRWSRATMILLPVSGVLLLSGISEVATDSVVGWTVPSLIAGAILLLVNVFALARGNHRALQVAIGIRQQVQPSEIEIQPPSAMAEGASGSEKNSDGT